MEFVEFIRERRRMTKCCKIGCDKCPLSGINNGLNINCGEFEDKYPEKVEKIIEEWAKEHPIETRQSEFLKVFPNASILADGIIGICPSVADRTFKCQTNLACSNCRKKYWLEEIKEDER